MYKVLGLLSLAPLYIIFQLYRGGQLYCRRKADFPVKTVDLPHVTKLDIYVLSLPNPIT